MGKFKMIERKLTDQELDAVILEKNDLIQRDVEHYKAANLEVTIAANYKDRGQLEDACVNWISAASCFVKAGETYSQLARQCLENAQKTTKISGVAKLAAVLLEELENKNV